jgi:Skp family chaperone for outer membrane proteins
MNVKTILARGVTLAAICSLAGTAVAQPTTGQVGNAPVTPPSAGPPLTGVCVFSFQRLVASSQVGHAVQARLQQIQSQVAAELNAEGTALNNDIHTFETQRATLTPAVQQQRGAALQARAQAFQQKQQQRSREMELTQQSAVGRIIQEMQPLLAQTYNTRLCSIVLDDNAVMAMNQAMDITPSVVTALDARIQTFTFERVQVNPQTGQPLAPGSAAPATGYTPAPAAPAAPATRPRR